MNKSRLESFSNELLLEVFDYLDVYSLYSAFHGLNQRFNGLIGRCPLHVVFDSTHYNDKTEEVWNSIASVVNGSQIRSLVLVKPGKIDERFINEKATNLRTLILVHVQKTMMDEVLSRLPSNLNLQNFAYNEGFGYHARNAERSMELAFKKHYPKLMKMVSCSFTTFEGYAAFETGSFEYLRRLYLHTPFLSLDSFQLIRHMSHLKSLYLGTNTGRMNALSAIPPLEHVQELDIHTTGDFQYLSTVLMAFPNLKKLHVLWNQRNQTLPVPDGLRWGQFLAVHCSNLKHFTLGFGDPGVSESILPSFYAGDFWQDKRVKVQRMVMKSTYHSPRVMKIYCGREWSFEYFKETPMDGTINR